MVHTRKLFIAPGIIWGSSVFIGLLSSVPQVAATHFNPVEAMVNAGITSTFAVVMWYFNIFMLSRQPARQQHQTISYSRLFKTLIFGLLIMLGLAWVQQLILSHINFGQTMLMVEVRGILINLVFYMFLHLVQQNYENQTVNIELERIKNDNLSAHYELLKQQVNPHFLFNSLTTLKAMVEAGDRDSVDFILKMSDFYRYTLESRQMDLIYVSEEMDIVKAYLFLQNARFEGGFDFNSQLDEDVMKTLIPPFTLQLLVENCLKHNVVSLDAPLVIRLFSEGERIVVSNIVQAKSGERNSLGVGLKNIQLRYNHLLEREIEISNDEHLFQVKLPIIYEHHHR